MNELSVLVDQDRRAVNETERLVTRIESADLALPTPCGSWTVQDLVEHMTGQQIGFAASARGGAAGLESWRPSVTAYSDACVDVLAAFAAPDIGVHHFALPEIRDGGTFPAPLAIGFHLVDNVVHAWDVAVSIGERLELDEDVVMAAVHIAERVPDGANRQVADAAFAPGRSATGTSGLDRILLLLGRSPAWPADSRPTVRPRTASR